MSPPAYQTAACLFPSLSRGGRGRRQFTVLNWEEEYTPGTGPYGKGTAGFDRETPAVL